MANEKLLVRVGADISSYKQKMKKMTSIGVNAAKKLTLAFVGVTTAAALIGSKFEQALVETATVAQAFGKELEALEDKARSLGETTAFTATEAAKGMYALASAGMDTFQIIGSIEFAMKLAGATGAEMSQATGLLAASMKQFGLEAEESKRIVDTYSAAITSSQLTMERLSEAMKFAGTTGSALGWTIEETTAAVAQFANLGLEGSMAGTNLRMAMVQLTKQSNKMKNALKEMNLTFEDVNPEANTFGEVLKAIGSRAITTKQAVEIFGTRAGLNMKKLAMAAHEGKSDFSGFVDMLEKSQQGVGRTTEMYDRMMDTFRGQWKIMLSAGQEMFITYFDQFKVQGKKAFEFISEEIRKVSAWIRENSDDIKGIFSSILVLMNTVYTYGFETARALALIAIEITGLKALLNIVGGTSPIKNLQKEIDILNIYLADTSKRLNELIAKPDWTKEDAKQVIEYTADIRKLTRQIDILQRALYQKKGTFAPLTEEEIRLAEKYIGVIGGWETSLEVASKSAKKVKEAVSELNDELRESQIYKNAVKELNALDESITDAYDSYKDFLYIFSITPDAIESSVADAVKELNTLDESITDAHYSYKDYLYIAEKTDKMSWETRLGYAQKYLGDVTGIFKQIADAGGKHSKKAFDLYKVTAAAQVVVSTAMAIMRIWAEAGPWAAPWLTGIVSALGATQLAVISASQPAGYAAGGWIEGGSGTRDDVLLGKTKEGRGTTMHWGMGGEFVVNKSAARKFGGLLELINESYASGGWVKHKGYGFNPIKGLSGALALPFGDLFDIPTPEMDLSEMENMIDSLNETIRLFTSTLSDLGQEVDDIIRKYKEELETAKKLGVSLDLVAEARMAELEALRGDISKDINDIIDSLTMTDYEQEMKSVNEWSDDMLEGILALAAAGIDTTGMIEDWTEATRLQGEEAAKAAIQTAKAELKDAKGFEDMIRELSNPREQWGVQDFIDEFGRLTNEISNLDETSETYLSNLLDLTQEQVGIMGHLEDLSRQTVESLKSSISSVDDMITSLRGGTMAPAQSMEFFQRQYDLLKAGAGTEEGLQAFQDFIPDYLDFMNAYGADYAELVGDVTSDLEEVKAVFENQLNAVEELLKDVVENTEDTTMELVGLAASNNMLLADMGTSIDTMVAVLVEGAIADRTAAEEAVAAAVIVAAAAEVAATAQAEAAVIAEAKAIADAEAAAIAAATAVTLAAEEAKVIAEAKAIADAAQATRNLQDWLDRAPSATGRTEPISPRQGGGFTGNQIGLVHPYEWVVPTKEPEASNFLRDVGADPEAIGMAVARHIGNGMPIQVNLVVDGSVLASVISNQMGVHPELTETTRKVLE